MSQETNGSEKSAPEEIAPMTLNDKIKKLDEQIEKFYEQINLPQTNVAESSVEEYINMTRTEIESMTPEGCGAASLQISSYIYYLQKIINKYKSRLNWLEQLSREEIGKISRDYQIYSYEEKKCAMLVDNTYLNKIHKYKPRIKSIWIV
jgi:hypothetical protein